MKHDNGSHHRNAQLISTAVGGIVAGWGASFFTAPFDVIRTRQAISFGSEQTDSIYRIFRRIWKTEGIKGLYRGIGSVQIALVPTWAIYFSSYTWLKGRLNERFPMAKDSTLLHMGSAMGAGIINDVLTNPLWMVKTRMQTQWVRGEVKYKSTFHAMRTIVHEEGVRALWQGLSPQLLGVTHVMIQFPLYEFLKRKLTLRRGITEGSPATTDVIIASSASKTVATIVAYPHEVLRTRFHYQSNKDKHRFLGLRDAIVKMWYSEGPSSFFKGLQANIIRTVPSCAVTFVLFELISHKVDLLLQRLY